MLQFINQTSLGSKI